MVFFFETHKLYKQNLETCSGHFDQCVNPNNGSSGQDLENIFLNKLIIMSPLLQYEKFVQQNIGKGGKDMVTYSTKIFTHYVVFFYPTAIKS